MDFWGDFPANPDRSSSEDQTNHSLQESLGQAVSFLELSELFAGLWAERCLQEHW